MTTTVQVANLAIGPCVGSEGAELHEVLITMQNGHKYTVQAPHKLIATAIDALSAEQVSYSALGMGKAHFGSTVSDLTANAALQSLIEISKATSETRIGGRDLAVTERFNVQTTEGQKAISVMILVAAAIAVIACAILFTFGTALVPLAAGTAATASALAVSSWALTGPAIGAAVLGLAGALGGTYMLSRALAKEDARLASTGLPEVKGSVANAA